MEIFENCANKQNEKLDDTKKISVHIETVQIIEDHAVSRIETLDFKRYLELESSENPIKFLNN